MPENVPMDQPDRIRGYVDHADLERFLQDVAHTVGYQWNEQELAGYIMDVSLSEVSDEDRPREFQFSGVAVEIGCLHDDCGGVRVLVQAPERFAPQIKALLLSHRPRDFE